MSFESRDEIVKVSGESCVRGVKFLIMISVGTVKPLKVLPKVEFGRVAREHPGGLAINTKVLGKGEKVLAN